MSQMQEKILSPQYFGKFSYYVNPRSPIVMGGGTETMYNQVNSIFS